MVKSPPHLHPFACFICRRSFKRPGVDRDEAACPACGNRAIRLSRKFKAPRRGDIAQWAKVEALVKLGFRFDTVYDAAGGGPVRYPASVRGIPAFVKKVAQLAVERAAGPKGRPKVARRSR